MDDYCELSIDFSAGKIVALSTELLDSGDRNSVVVVQKYFHLGGGIVLGDDCNKPFIYNNSPSVNRLESLGVKFSQGRSLELDYFELLSLGVIDELIIESDDISLIYFEVLVVGREKLSNVRIPFKRFLTFSQKLFFLFFCQFQILNSLTI